MAALGSHSFPFPPRSAAASSPTSSSGTAPGAGSSRCVSKSVTKRISRRSHHYLNRGIMRFSFLVLRLVAAFVSVLDIPCLRRRRGRTGEGRRRRAAGTPPGTGRIEDCLSPQTGTSCAVGDIPVQTGTLDAVGGRIPVPERASCPRQGRHAPRRVECPRPLENVPARTHPAPQGHSGTRGDNRRRRGPNSSPRTRVLSPPGTTRTQARRMSPAGGPVASTGRRGRGRWSMTGSPAAPSPVRGADQ